MQVLLESSARKALAREGQAPHSAIVGCADSRAALDRVGDSGLCPEKGRHDAGIQAKGRSCQGVSGSLDKKRQLQLQLKMRLLAAK